MNRQEDDVVRVIKEKYWFIGSAIDVADAKGCIREFGGFKAWSNSISGKATRIAMNAGKPRSGAASRPSHHGVGGCRAAIPRR